MEIIKDVPLAPLTTLKLGGRASYFALCKSEEDIQSAITFARDKQLPFCILGGGSNTIVSDKGYDGLVIKNEIFGIQEVVTTENDTIFEVGAGESWDDFVSRSVQLGLTGIECLSGIPGSVGASPIQNIGAYGQEVCESIKNVKMIDSELKIVSVSNEACNFRYRNSRFKSGDWNKNIVTQVTFKLSKQNSIPLKYPEVIKHWNAMNLENANRIEKLTAMRSLILRLRKSKSMVLDPLDPNTRSVGSFFMNPILSQNEKLILQDKIKDLNLINPQFFPEPYDTYKVSAAWLIENSGFQKGFVRDGVGISTAHSLALININGTTQSLLKLAEDITEAVRLRFSVTLSMEPVLLG